MNIKKRPKPRLERRNASKNIDYDASESTSTSSSFDNLSTATTRSLDVFQLSGRTSFRIDGIDGEFDRICRSLGLSGPEDFAIPAAAWEARKSRSPSDQFSGSRCSDNHKSSKLEVRGSSVDDLSDSFAAKVSFDDVVKRESECSRLKKGLYSARVGVGGEVKHENDELAQLNIVKDSVSVRCTRNGAGGIKGVRPPVLAPPPGMSLSVVDNLSSTWDIFRSFGPQDDEGLGGPGCVRVIGSSNEDEDEDEEYEGVHDRIIEKKDLNVRGTSDFSASCSDTSDNDNHDDSFSTTMESLFFISPNGQFRRNINSWQKGDFLGSGSFGTVYEGFTDDGFFFAVKEVSLLDQGSQGKQSIYQLQQEISLLSRLKHENIVQYLGTDKNDSKLYIFLELVTKGSLASLYQKYHLRDSQVSAYTRQILNGLNYLHGQNVIHRDIKCANILVDVNGYVKLADFGLAKATKFNEVKSCKGTPFWMAPEVVNQKGCGYGHAADIWSLGCTVLEMLTRKIPYSHLEGMQALFRIGRGEPPPIPNSLSRDAQDFVLKCLQVNPDGRPTAAQLLGHPFVKRPLGALLSPASPNFYGMQS